MAALCCRKCIRPSSGFYEDCKRDVEFLLTFFTFRFFTSARFHPQRAGRHGISIGGCVIRRFRTPSTFPAARREDSRKTCFYPWKACPSHKVLNPLMPEKRERTRYKLRNGICFPNRWTSPSIRKCFCLAFFCLVFSLPILAFFLEENFRRIGRGPGRGRSELLPRPGGGRHAAFDALFPDVTRAFRAFLPSDFTAPSGSSPL